MCRKKRFLIHLAYVAAIGALIVSGLGCFSGAAAREISIADATATMESEFMSYVTPDCPRVKEVLQDIVGDPPYEPSQAGFDDIRDWVAHNIDYKSDQERAGKADDWQTPKQTLDHPRVGDCEDFSLLLCSLLRAYGIDAARIYVAIGVDANESAHAFLIEDWNLDGEWRTIEPQAPTQTPSWLSRLVLPGSHPDSALSKYEIIAAFNDLYYYDEAFSWDEYQTDFWSQAEIEIETIFGDIVHQLSRAPGYLLGILSRIPAGLQNLLSISTAFLSGFGI